MVRNKLFWDASYTVGLSKQRKVGLDSIDSIPCDRILQRAYSLVSTTHIQLTGNIIIVSYYIKVSGIPSGKKLIKTIRYPQM